MKTIIQISILLLAILVGSIWHIFRPAIHDFLKPSKPAVVIGKDKQEKSGSAESKKKVALSVVIPPENTPISESGNSHKTEPANKDSLPTKVVLAPAPSPAHAPPVPTSADAMENQEAEIERIVMERYPDIANIPFSEKYSDLNKLPRRAYPARVQTHQKLNLKLTQEGKIVGLGAVKAEGFIRPLRVNGDKIEVSSLVNDEMLAELPLSETDFLAVIKANYDAGLKSAIMRLEKMRESGKSEIRKNPNLYKWLISEGKAWHESEDVRFIDVTAAYKQMPLARHFKPTQYFDSGYVLIDEDGPYSGGYSVIIVMLEGTDKGFGPYHWRVRCLLRDGRIIGWLDLPKEIATTP